MEMPPPGVPKVTARLPRPHGSLAHLSPSCSTRRNISRTNSPISSLAASTRCLCPPASHAAPASLPPCPPRAASRHVLSPAPWRAGSRAPPTCRSTAQAPGALGTPASHFGRRRTCLPHTQLPRTRPPSLLPAPLFQWLKKRGTANDVPGMFANLTVHEER
eukprot:scaffold41602_cov27-Tisochrysis_lutea.AAC.1